MKAAGAKERSIVYWRRLVWRDLAYWQRSVFPQMRDKPIRAHYEGQSWNDDPVALRRWQTGQTGFPLVDAGMRELWATGWMAQNVRMAAAILLCEHLNIHWIEGENGSSHQFHDVAKCWKERPGPVELHHECCFCREDSGSQRALHPSLVPGAFQTPCTVCSRTVGSA